MCELLAVSCDREVGVTVSWRAFQPLGTNSPHGWGYAHVDAGRIHVRRYVEPLHLDNTGDALLEPGVISSKLFLGHTRYRVAGAICVENTQPFVDERGTLSLAATMSKCRMNARFRASVADQLKGDTGPEVLFTLLKQTDSTVPLRDRIVDLFRRVFDPRDLPATAATSICVMSRSEMFCFAHGRQLWCLTRTPPHDEVVRFHDRRHRAFRAELQLEKGYDEVAAIIASARLTNERWTALPCRKVVRLRDGEIVEEVPV